jgi:hypothetical protein
MAFKNPIDQNVVELMPIETAPKDETRILLYGEIENDCGVVNDDETGTVPIKAFCEGYYWEDLKCWCHITGYRARPTHWMPLPNTTK